MMSSNTGSFEVLLQQVFAANMVDLSNHVDLLSVPLWDSIYQRVIASWKHLDWLDELMKEQLAHSLGPQC